MRRWICPAMAPVAVILTGAVWQRLDLEGGRKGRGRQEAPLLRAIVLSRPRCDLCKLRQG